MKFTFFALAICLLGYGGVAFAHSDLDLMIGRQLDFIYRIHIASPKGCTAEELGEADLFKSSRQKLNKDGLVSDKELIYAYMLYLDVAVCAEKISARDYCARQADYLQRLKDFYRKKDATHPLPAHFIENTVALKTRCSGVNS